MQQLPTLERTRRRGRVYGGRMGRMLSGRDLSAPCVFMHVPKCGGTSVSEALYATVPLHRKIGIIDAPSIRRALAIHHEDRDDLVTFHDEGPRADVISEFREQLLLMHMAHGARLIHGHFLFSERAYAHFGTQYKFVTILRDPVARTVSNYRMAVRRGVCPEGLDAFLETDMGRRMAQHTLRYFSGRATIAPGGEEAAREVALANMARFSVIGHIERLDAFVEMFRAVFGATPRVGHFNRAEGGEPDLTPAQRARLLELCAIDIELTDRSRHLPLEGAGATHA